MDWLEKNNFNRVIYWVKEKYKILMTWGIIAFVGLVSMTITVHNIKTENDDMCLAVQKWYEQIPDEHWIKNEDNKNFVEYKLMDIFEQTKNHAHTLYKLSSVAIGQEEKIGQFWEKVMETIDSQNEKKYCLKGSDGKTINNVTLEAGEECIVSFYYDETRMLLDFSEEEYMNEIWPWKNNNVSISNRIAFSYSDNPEIATIFNGHIIGICKGRTTIHFACNGYFFSYKIKVK